MSSFFPADSVAKVKLGATLGSLSSADNCVSTVEAATL